jgi:hypothetical protein
MRPRDTQAEFIYKIGLWLRPVLDVLDQPAAFDSTARRRRRAQAAQDCEKLEYDLGEFCRTQMGVGNSVEWHDIQGPLLRINSAIRENLDRDPEAVAVWIEREKPALLAGVAAVPIEDSLLTFDTATPYSTYCRLKPLFCVAAMEVVYIDRYLDGSLFYRYLSEVGRAVRVTLVGRPQIKNDPAFMDTSRMFASERGRNHYRLMEETTFHDRLLKIDDKVMLLGGSIRHAGHSSPFTLSTLPNEPASAQRVASVISAATEIFGPSQTSHP